MIMPKFISTALNIFWVTTPTNKGTSQNLRKFYTLRALRVCTDRSVSQHISCSNRARLSIHVLSCHLLLPVWSVFRNIIFIFQQQALPAAVFPQSVRDPITYV